MIADLKPYPAYKDSGVPWLGEVPEHWAIERLKSTMGNVIQQTTERQGTDLYIALEHVESWTGRLRQAASDVSFESHVKRFRSGDVLFGKLRPYLAKVTRPRSDGVCVGEFLVLRPHGSNTTTPYVEQLLRSKPIIDAVNSSTFGAKMPRADWQFMGGMAITLPPLSEQAAIVRFLDHANRRIRRCTHAKQELFKLLAEKREVVTDDALRLASTRSLPLRVVADRVDRPTTRRDDQVYTPIGLFNRGRGIFHKEPTKGAELGDSSFFWIEEGDLVLSGQFAWEGAIALAGQEDTGCVATHRYPVLRGKPNLVESAYLLSFFKTGLGHLLLDQHSRGAAGRNRPLNPRTLMKEKIPIPPLPVQQRITSIIHQENRLYRAVAKIVELLREYRTRLIADVVTGKLDVRDAASRLPGEAEEPEPLDEVESLSDTDEDAVDNFDATPVEAET